MDRLGIGARRCVRSGIRIGVNVTFSAVVVGVAEGWQGCLMSGWSGSRTTRSLFSGIVITNTPITNTLAGTGLNLGTEPN